MNYHMAHDHAMMDVTPFRTDARGRMPACEGSMSSSVEPDSLAVTG
jgi:hypothetical protein